MLILLGAIIAVSGLKTRGEAIGRFAWRAVLLMSSGFIAFASGIEHIGFIPSLAILIAVSSLSSTQFRWKELAAETVVLLIGCWAVFIYGLELPFPLFGR